MIVALLLTASIGQAQQWNEIAQSASYQTARSYLARHLPELAVPTLEQLLERPSLTPEARRVLELQLAQALLRAGRAQEALAQLPRPEVESETSSELTLHQTELLYWRAFAQIKLGRLADAREDLSMIPAQSRTPAAKLLQAQVEQELGEFATAQELLTALARREDLPLRQVRQIRHQLATLFLVQNEYSQAGQALDLVPRPNATTRYLQARIEQASGAPEKAIAIFKSLLSGDIKLSRNLRAQTVLELAKLLHDQGRCQEAANLLIDHLATYPTSLAYQPALSLLRHWTLGSQPFRALDRFKTLPPRPGRRNLLDRILTTSALALHESDSDSARQALEDLLTTSDDDPSSNFPFIQIEALLHLANDALDRKDSTAALASYQQLSDLQPAPALQSYLEGQLASLQMAAGDPDQAVALLTKARAEAPPSLLDPLTKNLASASAAVGLTETALALLAQAPTSPDLQLELGLTLATSDHPEGLDLLRAFIKDHPEHPRLDEARLAYLDLILRQPPTDTPTDAQKVLLSIKTTASNPDKTAEWLLRALPLGEGARTANSWLESQTGHPLRPDILYHLGRFHQARSSSGEAYRLFEQLAANFPDHPLARPSLLLAARNAFATNTPAADENVTFPRYQQIIETDPLLAPTARLEKAAGHLRYRESAVALETLAPLLDGKANLSNRLRATFLAGAAYRLAGDLDAEFSTYRDALRLPELPLFQKDRLQTLSGQVLERLAQPIEALQLYLEVIDRGLATDDPNRDWKWFDEAALAGALPLLERTSRWQAAQDLAERLASGPSSVAATAAKNRLQALRDQQSEE